MVGCYGKVITHTQMGFVYIYKWYRWPSRIIYIELKKFKIWFVVGGGYLCAPIKKKTGFFFVGYQRLMQVLFMNHECMEGIEAYGIEFQWI